VATVLVDGENVRRSLWPNMSRAELVDRSYAWAERHGHELSVVWEGVATADDEIARTVAEIEGPVWVVTSDRGLRERVAPRAELLIGGGSFARELRGS
jgi:predicted RNA-binding protein with PIN domain